MKDPAKGSRTEGLKGGGREAVDVHPAGQEDRVAESTPVGGEGTVFPAKGPGMEGEEVADRSLHNLRTRDSFLGKKVKEVPPDSLVLTESAGTVGLTGDVEGGHGEARRADLTVSRREAAKPEDICGTGLPFLSTFLKRNFEKKMHYVEKCILLSKYIIDCY